MKLLPTLDLASFRLVQSSCDENPLGSLGHDDFI